MGGGFTFLHTFEKYLTRLGHQVVGKDKADIYFISGATMVARDEVLAMKAAGKKIVLRVDNIPRNSRNRNTGTSRLFDFAQLADLVVYQSQWAKDYISPFLKKDGPVILNGADTEIFKPSGEARPKDGDPQYMFVQFNRDETKQWHVAWYEYIMLHRAKPNAHLWIVGNFSPEQEQYKFDFFMGEKYQYIGVVNEPEEMAELYRGADVLLYTYFNDACSQTLIEARNCGLAVKAIETSGGAKEILEAPIQDLGAAVMTEKYLAELAKL